MAAEALRAVPGLAIHAMQDLPPELHYRLASRSGKTSASIAAAVSGGSLRSTAL